MAVRGQHLAQSAKAVLAALQILPGQIDRAVLIMKAARKQTISLMTHGMTTVCEASLQALASEMQVLAAKKIFAHPFDHSRRQLTAVDL